MPKLYSARVVLKTLQKASFTISSQRGSHIKLVKQSENKTLTVIVPNHKEIAIGTFQSILKQANMTKIQFAKYL